MLSDHTSRLFLTIIFVYSIVCLTVGAYSKWLDTAPNGMSFIPSVIEVLVNGMSISEDSAAAASLAFRHICDGIEYLLII